MPTTTHRLLQPAAAEIDALAQLRIDCVAGGASVGFMHPLSLPKARGGWQRCGTVPGNALLPHGGLCATTFFYRELR